MSTSPITPSINELLDRASQGQTNSLRDFFRVFLTTTLYLPTRKQNKPLRGQAEYPNEFFMLLGLQGPDGNFIPAFTNESFCEEWAGFRMLVTTTNGKELCERVPPGWFIELNPHQPASKQFSPWEISQLRFGEVSLDEVVSENTAHALSEGVEVREPEESPVTAKLRKAVEDECPRFNEILSATAAVAVGVTESGRSQTFIIGLELTTSENSETAVKQLSEVLRPLLIGEGELAVVTFSQTNLENADLFAGLDTWYTRETSDGEGFQK